MGIKEDDLIKYLDAFMSGDGGSVKPIIDENGEVNFVTTRESVVSQAANEELRKAEALFGEKFGSESSIFTDDVDDDCPSCASIPNLDEFDDEW